MSGLAMYDRDKRFNAHYQEDTGECYVKYNGAIRYNFRASCIKFQYSLDIKWLVNEVWNL